MRGKHVLGGLTTVSSVMILMVQSASVAAAGTTKPAVPVLGKIVSQGTSDTYTWNGTKWTMLPHLNVSEIRNAVIHSGKLYVVTEKNVYEYSRSSWIQLGGTLDNPDFPIVYNGHLVIATNSDVMQWTGKTWAVLGNSLRLPGSFAIYNSHLYANTANGVFELSGSRWSPVGHVSKQAVSDEVGQLSVVNGKLYLAQGAVWEWTGSTWSEVGHLLNNVGLSTSRSNEVQNAQPVSLLSIKGKLTVSTGFDGVWQWDGINWIRYTDIDQLNNANGETPFLYTRNGLTMAENDYTFKWNGSSWVEFNPQPPKDTGLVPIE